MTTPISRYFYIAITEPIDFNYYDGVMPKEQEYLQCECDLDAHTIKIGSKKYDVHSFIKAADMLRQALRQRESDRMMFSSELRERYFR